MTLLTQHFGHGTSKTTKLQQRIEHTTSGTVTSTLAPVKWNQVRGHIKLSRILGHLWWLPLTGKRDWELQASELITLNSRSRRVFPPIYAFPIWQLAKVAAVGARCCVRLCVLVINLRGTKAWKATDRVTSAAALLAGLLWQPPRGSIHECSQVWTVKEKPIQDQFWVV